MFTISLKGNYFYESTVRFSVDSVVVQGFGVDGGLLKLTYVGRV